MLANTSPCSEASGYIRSCISFNKLTLPNAFGYFFSKLVILQGHKRVTIIIANFLEGNLSAKTKKIASLLPKSAKSQNNY